MTVVRNRILALSLTVLGAAAVPAHGASYKSCQDNLKSANDGSDDLFDVYNTVLSGTRAGVVYASGFTPSGPVMASSSQPPVPATQAAAWLETFYSRFATRSQARRWATADSVRDLHVESVLRRMIAHRPSLFPDFAVAGDSDPSFMDEGEYGDRLEIWLQTSNRSLRHFAGDLFAIAGNYAQSYRFSAARRILEKLLELEAEAPLEDGWSREHMQRLVIQLYGYDLALGRPLDLARLERHTETWVNEFGYRHPRQRLTTIARNIALVNGHLTRVRQRPLTDQEQSFILHQLQLLRDGENRSTVRRIGANPEIYRVLNMVVEMRPPANDWLDRGTAQFLHNVIDAGRRHSSGP